MIFFIFYSKDETSLAVAGVDISSFVSYGK